MKSLLQEHGSAMVAVRSWISAVVAALCHTRVLLEQYLGVLASFRS